MAKVTCDDNAMIRKTISADSMLHLQGADQSENSH